MNKGIQNSLFSRGEMDADYYYYYYYQGFVLIIVCLLRVAVVAGKTLPKIDTDTQVKTH